MSNVLVIGFENFKKLSDNKRVYYYIAEDHYEFDMVSDGIIVKTNILKADIEDAQKLIDEAKALVKKNAE